MTRRTYVQSLLFKTAYRKVDLDAFLNPGATHWTRFDPDLGYVPKSVVMQDGANGAWSRYTFGPGGFRQLINHAEKPCRLNTYGDSFTQCQQVSDGETWQEYLAAHLGEPIRNFGVGGYSVHTACLRARRMEATEHGAEYVILNIFDDDSLRNLDALRRIRTSVHLPVPTDDKPVLLNGVPWPYLRIDLDTGRFAEHPSVCPDGESLRALSDRDRFYSVFKDDLIVNLFVLREGGQIADRHRQNLGRLAEILGINANLRSPADAERLHITYALKSTEYLLDQMQQWAARHRKKFRVILCYGRTNTGYALEGRDRFDQSLLDYLNRSGLPFIDTLPKHLEHFRLYRLKPVEYLDHLFIPPSGAALCNHHNPTANHWFAFAIKDELVNWLDPKPPTILMTNTAATNCALMFDPHPDDSEFWSGGLTLLLVQAGWQVHYACCGETTAETRAQAEAAAKLAGVTRHFLEIPLTGNSRLRNQLREKVVALMQQLQPKLTFSVALTDYHQEHCDLTRELLPLLRAYRRFKFPETEIYTFDSHDGRDPVEIYIDITDVFDRHMEVLRCHKVFEKPDRFPPGENTLTRVKTGRAMMLGASVPHSHTRCLHAEGYHMIWGHPTEVTTLKLLFPDRFHYRSPNWLRSMWYT